MPSAVPTVVFAPWSAGLRERKIFKLPFSGCDSLEVAGVSQAEQKKGGTTKNA